MCKSVCKMSDLDDIKNKIRNAMTSQGTYIPDLDLCIELCAGSYMAVSYTHLTLPTSDLV